MSVRKIARTLGVSPSAVSLALRNSTKISKPLKLRVKREADRISYHPSGKVAELMSHLRAAKAGKNLECFAVMSLYDEPFPWEKSKHLSGIFASMAKRAEVLGFRIEPLWLKAPGMSPRRFRDILETRGIQGLLCFGSPYPKERFPSELKQFATVTVGLSIDAPMHRVIANFINDCFLTLNKVHARGYRRPGIVVGSLVHGIRSISSYLGWCEINLGSNKALPPLELSVFSYAKFAAWRKKYRPDVIIMANGDAAIQGFIASMRAQRIRIPEDIGVALITHIIETGQYSGIQQNQRLMGEWAVELLISRIHSQDFGIPKNPRLEMVDGEWIDGNSL